MNVRPVTLSLALLAGALLAVEPAAAQQNRFEPNDSRRTAARVPAGDYKELLCNGEDWYFLDVRAGQRLEVAARFDAAQGDLDLELQDARGRMLAWSRGTEGREGLTFAVEADQPLFLRVHNARTLYDLHVGVGDSAFRGPGEPVSVRGKGSDWYLVEVPEGRSLRVEARFAHAEGDLDVALRDPEGNELALASGQGDTEVVSWTAERAARVLVEVYEVRRAEVGYALRLSVGQAIPDDMTRVFQRERLEGAGRDLLEMRNGDLVKAEVLTEELRITTAYTTLDLPLRALAGIELGRTPSDVETVVTVDNGRLTGFMGTPALRVRLEGLDEPVTIPRERLARVVFGRRGSERAGIERHQQFMLTNGDHWSARLEAEAWALDTGYARLPLRLEQVQSITFEASEQVVVRRLDGSTARGRLDVGTVRLHLDPLAGGAPHAFDLHRDRIETIYVQPGFVPDSLRVVGRALSFDFEGSLDPWVAQGNWNTNWVFWPQDGVRGAGCARACGPNGANYGDNANVTLTSPALSIASLQRPVLRLQVKSRLERGPDFLAVRASYDGGSTYAELHRLTGDNEWTQLTLPLQAGQREVVVQLGLTSDGSIVNQGLWVDALEIVEGPE